MNKKKKIFFLIFVFVIIIMLVAIGYSFINNQINYLKKEESGMTFYLPRSNSFASNWNYKMSNTNVLREVEEDIFCYVGCDFDYWKFEPVGTGEVTIYFTAQYQTEMVEEDCFSITYYVDAERNVTEISSENRPENVNFKGNEGYLLFIRIYDEWLLHLRNLLARIFGVWA